MPLRTGQPSAVTLLPGTTPFDNQHKRRRGWSRLWHATGHSLNGLREAWHEAAFRLELLVCLVLVPLAPWLGRSWLESVVLVGSLAALLVVELLNTAVEAAIDRVGTEWHVLSKRAKDLGSAAVLVCTAFVACLWVSAAWRAWA